MEGVRFSPSRTYERDASHVLFSRQTCAVCPDTVPTCPTCPSGQSCQVTVPLTCTECSKAYCAKNVDSLPSSSSSSKSGSSSSTGAIAGGVVGGVAVIAILTYLIWRFCIKAKRQPSKLEEDGEYSGSQLDPDSQSFAARRAKRSSTHTVHSIASTVLTRASNIIQIAYIPGVTNRAPPTSPNVLVPPVPPIPIALSNSNSNSLSPAGTDQHFFVPGDLRDSTYSDFSAFSEADRSSYARTSFAPRSSIASTIYGKNAVIVPPPQTGMRIKPTMVNLKSGSGPYAPPVPSVDYEKYNGSKLRPVSVANSTFSIGSTFLNNASTATAMPVRPVVVRVGTASKKSEASTHSSAGDEKDGSKLNAETFSEKSSLGASAPRADDSHGFKTYTIPEATADQGPFQDPPETPSSSMTHGSGPESPTATTTRNTNALSAVIEEATRRASQKDISRRSSKSTQKSPFEDGN